MNRQQENSFSERKKKQRPLIFNYSAITNEKRQQLIRLVVFEKLDVKEVSDYLQINSYSAKSILRRYYKTGTILRKNKIAKLNSNKQNELLDTLERQRDKREDLDEFKFNPFDEVAMKGQPINSMLADHKNQNMNLLQINVKRQDYTENAVPRSIPTEINERKQIFSLQGLPQNFNTQSLNISYQKEFNLYQREVTQSYNYESKAKKMTQEDDTSDRIVFDFKYYDQPILSNFIVRTYNPKGLANYSHKF